MVVGPGFRHRYDSKWVGKGDAWRGLGVMWREGGCWPTTSNMDCRVSRRFDLPTTRWRYDGIS